MEKLILKKYLFLEVNIDFSMKFCFSLCKTFKVYKTRILHFLWW